VQGRYDTVIPQKTTQLLREGIAGCRYAEIDGAGHFPALTRPDEFNSVLTAFLSQHDTPTTGKGAQ
jgi:pimeloyl-ACP methyl ester carboxylesterase